MLFNGFVYLVLILTMHKLELALKLLLSNMELDQLKRQECCGIGFAILFASAYLAFSLYLSLDPDEMFSTHIWPSFGILCVIMTFTYIFMIVKLNLIMKRLEGNFDQEKRSVNSQFIVFLLA